MKVFFVGGLYTPSSPSDVAPDQELMRSSMRELGSVIAASGHELLVCSPYEGSIDLEILRGVAAAKEKPRIQMHFPQTQENLSAVQSLVSLLGIEVKLFPHAGCPSGDQQAIRYAWLLSQLSALDAAHIVVAAAGNPAGSANMLLHLAETRGRPVLPFAHLGGAAAQCLERQRYVLDDILGELKSWLRAPKPMGRIEEALNLLAAPLQPRTRLPASRNRFFISYARERAGEADLVETLLRRRGCEVFRDDHTFHPSGELQREIESSVRKSDVFIALWSAEYACSPWCHDEMVIALEQREANTLDIWLLQLDETRIVPRGARNLVPHVCRSREQLQSAILRLLDRTTGR